MAHEIMTGGVHHIQLTVSDVSNSCEFYTSLLGFKSQREIPRGMMLSNGSVTLVVSLASNPTRAQKGDRFDENRIGLDHISFAVKNREELEKAEDILQERGIPHGEIEDMGQSFAIYVLALRDPDGIQIELTAPYS